ncbi:hypothetical protein HNY73_019502 [Argiope bruennichi]|uniref:DDE-1 domain-containing protein n=1 Tax=Argiope bruennichi TaxID=94029 RepID=A0A8T0E536_ARGBR|nr:hypothetical protein HNY73_019502 [Argiope bruennichi]
MKEEHFMHFAEHFVLYTKSTKERPTLLLLDNHDSHLPISALNYLKANGVVVLSFIPHCSQKQEPLDYSMYGLLKKYVNSTCDSWHRNNPGKTMKIYDIPGIIETVLPLATTESKITSGLATTEISPLNPDIFPDSEFFPSCVTDRPQPTSNISQSDSSNLYCICSNLMPTDPDETSKAEHERNGTQLLQVLSSPDPEVLIPHTVSPLEELWSLPKAGARQRTRKRKTKNWKVAKGEMQRKKTKFVRQIFHSKSEEEWRSPDDEDDVDEL